MIAIFTSAFVKGVPDEVSLLFTVHFPIDFLANFYFTQREFD